MLLLSGLSGKAAVLRALKGAGSHAAAKGWGPLCLPLPWAPEGGGVLGKAWTQPGLPRRGERRGSARGYSRRHRSWGAGCATHRHMGDGIAQAAPATLGAGTAETRASPLLPSDVWDLAVQGGR